MEICMEIDDLFCWNSIPSGFKPALSKFDSVFDKEVLEDDDKELWLIRIPDNVCCMPR